MDNDFFVAMQTGMTNPPQVVMGFPAQQGIGVAPQQQGMMGNYPQQPTGLGFSQPSNIMGNPQQQFAAMRFANPATSSVFPANTATHSGGGNIGSFGK